MTRACPGRCAQGMFELVKKGGAFFDKLKSIFKTFIKVLKMR
jgi:hypothetical protein